MSTTTVDLSTSELELVRRQAMENAATDLRTAANMLADLSEQSPWPIHSRSTDTQNAVALAREALDLVDKLGWPEDADQGTDR